MISQKKNSIDLSVIIPCFNDGQYLAEALNSLVGIKDLEYEIIIVNDGSDDRKTLDFLNDLDVNKYQIIHQENSGPAVARNNAIKQSRGEYLLPLDADNLVVPAYIIKGIKILRTNKNIDIVYSDRQEFGLHNKIVKQPDFDIDKLVSDNYIDTCAIFRKNVWETCGGYDAQMNGLEDWEFWINAYKKGFRFFHLNEPLFFYRKKPESLSGTFNDYCQRLQKLKYLYAKHSEVIDKVLAKMNSVIADQRQVIADQRQVIADQQNQLTDIKDSISWKLLRQWQKIVDWLLSKIITEDQRRRLVGILRKKFASRQLEVGQTSLVEDNKPNDHQKGIQTIDIDENKLNQAHQFQLKNSVNPIVKIIAFYLPQFHPFAENSRFWGEGFTDWVNVKKAQPNFTEHYQPRQPGDLGYYDLRDVKVMARQAELAKNYGVNGFCFYYYWFSGKKLMQTPLENIYNHREIDIDYCMCWANENWTRSWDGLDKDILINQRYSEDDYSQFIVDASQFFDDPRYIKINGRPLLLVYNINAIPKLDQAISVWRNYVKKLGYPDLYLTAVKSFDLGDNFDLPVDALVDFPPHGVKLSNINNSLRIINPKFHGRIYRYDDAVNFFIKRQVGGKKFESVMLGWDNTARKQDNSDIFYDSTPLKYKQWLSGAIHKTIGNHSLDSQEKLVFVNAWNEWAEGSYLEPDDKYSFAYLNATYEAIRHCDQNLAEYFLPRQFVRQNKVAVIFHLYYWECLEDFVTRVRMLQTNIDIYITLSEDRAEKENVVYLLSLLPKANIIIFENRGRDVLPFIKLFAVIEKLGYDAICKIHSKKSPYRLDGRRLYRDLLGGLLNDEAIQRLVADKRAGLGILEDFAFRINAKINNQDSLQNNRVVLSDLCNRLGIVFDESEYFPAGTMFWFKPTALQGITGIGSWDFGVEQGLVDGTTAHAVERIFGLLCKKNGYEILKIDSKNIDS